MADLIDRQAAIRWIKTECNPYGKPTLDFESGKKVIEYLWQMPSTQPELDTGLYADGFADGYEQGKKDAQPEIIRCKDCAKREHCRASTVWAVAPGDDWYCADAERRTDV